MRFSNYLVGRTSNREVLLSKLIDERCWVEPNHVRRPNCSEFSVVFFEPWISLRKYELDSLRHPPLPATHTHEKHTLQAYIPRPSQKTITPTRSLLNIIFCLLKRRPFFTVFDYTGKRFLIHA